MWVLVWLASWLAGWLACFLSFIHSKKMSEWSSNLITQNAYVVLERINNSDNGNNLLYSNYIYQMLF